jgi:PAS domain-containing protein
VCVKALAEKGFVEDFRLRLRKKDGTIMECLFTGTVQRDTEGAVRAYQGTIRDETEKNRVERAWRDTERTLQSVLAGSPAAQFAIDRNHRVFHWNRALELMTGVKAEEVMGTKDHWKGFYPNERPCMADLMVDDGLGKIPEWYGGKSSRSSTVDGAYNATDFFNFRGKRGKWLCFTASAILDSHNEVIGALETLEDVTPEKFAARGEE